MKELATLAQLTRAGYAREKHKLQHILAEEAALRTELARLDDMNSRAQEKTDESLRAIGADIIWQGWVGRAKTRLNMKLARVLAKKEHHQTLVRKAYGKVLVTDELVTRAQKDGQKREATRALDQAIDQSLF